MKQYTKIIAALLINTLAISFALASTIPAPVKNAPTRTAAPVSYKKEPSKQLDKATLLKRIASAEKLSANELTQLTKDVTAFAIKNTDDKSLIGFTTNVQGYAAEVTNTKKLIKNNPRKAGRWGGTDWVSHLSELTPAFQQKYDAIKKISYYVPNKHSVKEVLIKFADQLIKIREGLEWEAFQDDEGISYI